MQSKVCLMSPVLDTAFIPPRDREEVVRNAVWESMVAVDIDHRPAAEDISVRIGLGTAGPIRICSARATAVTLRRTEQLARKDEEPAVTLGVQMTGSSVVVQNGRECLLRPGGFAVYESIAPYIHLFDKGVDYRFIRFPRAALALPDRLLRDITAVPPGIRQPHCTPRLPLLLPTGHHRRLAPGWARRRHRGTQHRTPACCPDVPARQLQPGQGTVGGDAQPADHSVHPEAPG